MQAQDLSGPIKASYDALGERTRLSDGSGTTSFAYDALGRTTAITAPGTGTIGYGYDAAGQRTSLRYPDGRTLGYSYYPDGQLKSVTQGGTSLAGYTYDAAGRLHQVSQANGAVTSYSYDGADRLRDLSTTINGTLRARFQYEVDRLGQRTTVTETLPLTTTAPATSTATPPLSSTGSCALYPIALSAQTLAGVALSTTISGIGNGTRPGNFGWLSWTGDTSDPTLVSSLTPPGDSATYINPTDPTDHTLAAGKSVSGRPGVTNSSALRAALDQLKTQDLTVPVWDTTSGSGSTATYHVSAFARVRLLDYQLPANKDLLSLRFLGYTDCGAASGGSPTPTSTPEPLSSTRVITYAYDGLQRLTDAVENPGTSYHYAYDPAGNRTDVVVNGTLDTHQDYDAANQVVGWGYDAAGNVISDPKTHKVEAKAVQAVRHDPAAPLMAIHLSDGSTITTTLTHAFWVDAVVGLAHAGWFYAQHLRAGDQLRTATGKHVAVVRLRYNVGRADVYALTVAHDHTFFVGTARVLVHNADCPLFRSGQDFERTLHTPQGTIGILAETAIEGDTVVLKHGVVYPAGSTAPIRGGMQNAVILRSVVRSIAADAKEQGFKYVKLEGIRVPGSTSASPRHVIDVLIDTETGRIVR